MQKLWFAISLALCVACSEAAPPPAAVPVVVADVTTRDVPITLDLIGTTEGAVDATIRAQVSGYLIAREYKEGTAVEEGAVLFRIDPRIYRATLEQARGDLERARAGLAKARQDVERYTPLAREGAVSQQELDDAVQAARAGQAAVQTAQATLEKARIDLAFTEIRSPISGIAGVASAQVGDLVGPNDPEPLTTVSQLDPIRVAFSLSEREYLRFRRDFREAAEGGSPREATLELILADGSTWPHRGRAVPAAAGVDSRTGTFFVERPIVAIVISIVMVIVGAVGPPGAADRAVPRHRPARDPGHDDLHGRDAVTSSRPSRRRSSSRSTASTTCST
jgi:membrane fusion protein, multidrug efflux system